METRSHHALPKEPKNLRFLTSNKFAFATIIPRQSVDGVKGSKPRGPGPKSAEKVDGKVSKAELSRLNREYLAARNRTQAAKAEAAEIALAEKKGTVISLQLVRL